MKRFTPEARQPVRHFPQDPGRFRFGLAQFVRNLPGALKGFVDDDATVDDEERSQRSCSLWAFPPGLEGQGKDGNVNGGGLARTRGEAEDGRPAPFGRYLPGEPRLPWEGTIAMQ